MIHTPVCELLEIEHPIAIGGMGSIFSPDLVASVSNAGGLGALGCHNLNTTQIHDAVTTIRALTKNAFALNFLIFDIEEECFQTALEEKPAIMAFAWPYAHQNIKSFIDRAHNAGCKVTFMVNGLPEAVKAADAGADVIIAQGTEGGGHVGWISTMCLVPMVVDAVAPIPVLAAGGFADGRGLAAALSLGADGVLMGTRFLASKESPLHKNFKQAILDTDGHNTMLTEIPDLAAGKIWPGAMSRAYRNQFIERWAGREWEIRQKRDEIFETVKEARLSGNIDEAPLSMGQDSGLINDIPTASEIVKRVAKEAEQIMRSVLPKILK